PILKGCLLEVEKENITSVAIDGYRLAKVEEPLKETTFEGKIIVPAKSLGEIAKLLEDSDEIINVYVQKSFVMIDLKATKIISRLFEGEFINYKQIISKTFDTKIKVEKSKFENTLERAAILSKIGQNNIVQFEIKENNLHVTSNSEIGNIKENIEINLSGKDLVIAFNAKYFNDCFRVINTDVIEVGFNSPSNPCVITSIDNKEFLYLILPVRIFS
ncbi:MAG: DNA polymerase III subunit beta, partial [Clostridia bacterium]|nr:DNA polymerase III subunit beta [Clostridia bacterium]